ncbi:MAG: tetratricopeptide repeat protein [Polyangia bacterium]|jgi:serine/threonine protein kinase/predicted negative regulator of RcsB-dependent stress response|nr:tetratricopeptide repeat protein [Polyangia bacterium]
MSFEPFQIGRFRCVHELTSGSMAAVYVARYQGLEGFQKLVVLKRVHDRVAADDEFVRRFVANARLWAALSHAGIVKVLECAVEGGAYLLATEYVEGVSLAQLLASLGRRGRKLPLPTVAAIVMAVSDVVDFAHRFKDPSSGRTGVIHGGLRPSKVLLPRARGVKVLDFGVAEAFSFARRALAEPDWMGNAYLAPEVHGGAPPSAAADIFSLGALLFELATGEPLFLRSDMASTLGAVREGVVPRHQALPEHFWELISSAVAPEPSARVSSASDLHDVLARYLAGQRLAPSTAWAMGELQPLYSDWALELPEEPEVPQGKDDPIAKELKARRRLATVALARRPEGLLGGQASSAIQETWDPVQALQDSLEPGSGSFLKGHTVADALPIGRPAGPGMAPLAKEARSRFSTKRGSGQADAGGEWGEVATLSEDFSILPSSGSGEPDVQDPLGDPDIPMVRVREDAEFAESALDSVLEQLPGESGGLAMSRGAEEPSGTGQQEEGMTSGLESPSPVKSQDLSARIMLAGVFRQQGRFEEAERELKALLQEQPGYAPAWHQLGMLKQQIGKRQEALEHIQRALAEDPTLLEARLTLAAVHLSVGEVDDAIAALTAVVATNWRSGGAHRLLARCFLRVGDPSAALEHCEYAASFGEQVEALRREILARL